MGSRLSSSAFIFCCSKPSASGSSIKPSTRRKGSWPERSKRCDAAQVPSSRKVVYFTAILWWYPTNTERASCRCVCGLVVTSTQNTWSRPWWTMGDTLRTGIWASSFA